MITCINTVCISVLLFFVMPLSFRRHFGSISIIRRAKQCWYSNIAIEKQLIELILCVSCHRPRRSEIMRNRGGEGIDHRLRQRVEQVQVCGIPKLDTAIPQKFIILMSTYMHNVCMCYCVYAVRCCCLLNPSVSACFQFLTSADCKFVDLAAVALELQHLYRQASALGSRALCCGVLTLLQTCFIQNPCGAASVSEKD